MSDELVDKKYDSVASTADAIISRHIKLAHRIDLILLALKRAEIPFSMFTVEALNEIAATIEVACDESHADDDD